MKNPTLLLIAFGLLFQSLSSAFASPINLKSTDKPPTFLELYTSQGCSSCPPAEQWLSTFTNHKQLWTEIIPLNFHVDYWDYLGWKDPFGSNRFTQRQRHYKRIGRTRNVATPGFVVDGKGWNGWFRQQPIPLSESITTPNQNNHLEATITNNSVLVTSTSTDKNLVVNVAILGFGINTEVKTGENRGRQLAHDFVVIGYKKQALKPLNRNSAEPVLLPQTREVTTTRRGIVIWLSTPSDIAPIQAVAGWIN